MQQTDEEAGFVGVLLLVCNGVEAEAELKQWCEAWDTHTWWL